MSSASAIQVGKSTFTRCVCLLDVGNELLKQMGRQLVPSSPSRRDPRLINWGSFRLLLVRTGVAVTNARVKINWAAIRVLDQLFLSQGS